MTRIRGLAATVATLVAAATAASADAGPASDAFVMIGTGTVVPGLPTSGCAAQETTFSGTVVEAGDETQIPATLAMDGTSTGCGTLESDSGTGSMSGAVGGTVSYTRDAEAVMTITGDVTVGGETHGLLATCQWIPTSINPIVSYAVTCQALLTS